MGPEPLLRIELAEQAGDWSALDAASRMGPVARAIVARLGEDGATGTVTLVLGDDAMVRDLNRRFRGIDKPTNVLSFPDEDHGFEGPEAGRSPPGSDIGDTHLGDVILAVETLAREARDEGKPVEHHFDHLVVHGTLHILGYDHESDDDADRMESLETAILADLGIADPYGAPAMSAAAT